MAKKIEIDRDELYDLYILQNKTTEEVADCLNVSRSFVMDRLKKFQIKKDINKIIELREKTNLKKYGCKCSSQNEKVKEKIRKTNLEKYGCECILKSDKIKEKIKKTNLEKFGFEYPSQADCIKEKVKNTNRSKWGVDCTLQSEEVKDKIKKTNLEKYGVEYISQSKEIQEKIIKTNLEKFGVERPAQNIEVLNKMEKTTLERFGVTNAMKTSEIMKKVQASNIEKYGVEYSWQNEEIKEKIKKTNLERYGVENPSYSKDILDKIRDTKNKNKSWSISKPEELFYNKLISIYGEDDIIRQYKDGRYPFACDFYIKSKDLFIELNLSWTHGPHPFDKNNEEDIKLLNKWKKRSKKSEYYENAVYTWTVSDVKKQKTAKDNCLNYIMYYEGDDLNNDI